MYKEIKKYIQNYEKLKDKILGNLELESYKYCLRDYFTHTYMGDSTSKQVENYLREEVSYRKQQEIDLRYVSDIRFKWKRLERVSGGYRIWVSIDKCIKYKGVQEESVLKNQLKEFLISEVNGKFKIEREWTGGMEIRERSNGKDKSKKRIVRYRAEVKEQVVPKGKYIRVDAVEYAKKYALTPNTQQWKNYEKYGGDCTNFISQCLYAGGIPFDHVGEYITEKWYWYSDTYRTPSFTSANALKTYMMADKVTGLICNLVENKEELDVGDIVQLGDVKGTTHSMIVVGKVYSKENPTQLLDLLIAQHSTDILGRGYNIPLSTKPNKRLYFKVLGYNS